MKDNDYNNNKPLSGSWFDRVFTLNSVTVKKKKLFNGFLKTVKVEVLLIYSFEAQNPQ